MNLKSWTIRGVLIAAAAWVAEILQDPERTAAAADVAEAVGEAAGGDYVSIAKVVGMAIAAIGARNAAGRLGADPKPEPDAG